MKRVGVPKKIINFLFTTLQEAVHRVRTGFGDSISFYGGKVWLVPIHGIGQGNGAGPAIWAVVSTPLLNVLRERLWMRSDLPFVKLLLPLCRLCVRGRHGCHPVCTY
jgi:hypothetical protein